jgi:glycoside/pentoside/hexuronide:cation symporter, GPH family
MSLKVKDPGDISDSNRINFSQLAAYGSGGIIPIALFNVAGILVGLMGNISLGLSAFWLGVILIIPRLWDAVSDPIIGHLSDNTRTRWGRRRPFLLVGGILVAIFFVMIWWIPRGEMVRTWFPSESGFHWFQLGYILFSLLLFFTACTIFEIPHGALGMEMTSDPHIRTRLFSAKSFVGNLFAMSTPWLFALANMEIFRGPGGNEADGMRYVSLMVAAIIIPLSFWWFFSLREPGFRRASQQKKTPFWEDMKHTATNKNFVRLTLTIFTLAMGFNFVNLLGSYIPIFYIFDGDKVAGAYLLGINGTIWAVTGLLAVFPLNWVSPKLGKRNTLIVAVMLMVLAQLSKIICYNPAHPYLIIIPTILLSAGMLFFFTLGSSMVGDICDEDDLKRGYRTEGSFYSIFWWFIKMGTAFASFVAGALIVLTMFDQTQVTKVDAIQGNVRELRSNIQTWDGSLTGNSGADLFEVTKELADAVLKESKDFILLLQTELQRKHDRSDESDTEQQTLRKSYIQTALGNAKSLATRLENLTLAFGNANNQEREEGKAFYAQYIAMAIETKIEKARLNAFDLYIHIENESHKTQKSNVHYQELIQFCSEVKGKLDNIKPGADWKRIDLELSAVENIVVPLKKQSPYTLLMMRVVEIGLPILLSIFSMIFILKYTLTEKNLQEVKIKLRERNASRDDEDKGKTVFNNT